MSAKPPGLIVTLTWLAPCGCELDFFTEVPTPVDLSDLKNIGARAAGIALSTAMTRCPRHLCQLVSEDNPNGIAEPH